MHTQTHIDRHSHKEKPKEKQTKEKKISYEKNTTQKLGVTHYQKVIEQVTQKSLIASITTQPDHRRWTPPPKKKTGP